MRRLALRPNRGKPLPWLALACLLGIAIPAAPVYAAAPEFSLYDVWHQYHWQAIFSLVAAGLTLLLSLWVLVGNRRLNAAHHTVVQQKRQLEASSNMK